ncbi:hypothetical protein E3N88_23689 [Mikania micrantha]|uniref:Uncharacterized protein n=1 Tax=Mikania micrantha TaxID=192012 RepID=A0A5N6NGM9_9ASTR|nr:hypothetical protein E3N88_23689 [Mikania micrantha]
MGLQEVGAYLKLDKTEAMLQPLTMHAEDFPPLSNLYDDGSVLKLLDCSGSGIIGSFRQSEELRCLITIIYCPFTGIHQINGVIGSALGCAYRRGLPSVSTTRNAVVLEHLVNNLVPSNVLNSTPKDMLSLTSHNLDFVVSSGPQSADHVCEALLEKRWTKPLQEEVLRVFVFQFFKTSSPRTPTLTPPSLTVAHQPPDPPPCLRIEATG